MATKPRRWRLFGAVIATTVLIGTSAAGATGATRADSASTGNFDSIDTYFKHTVRDMNMPGAELGIVHGDRIVHLSAYGEASKDRDATPQTPFKIGSISKSFTAVAVMQLVEQGKIDLDTPVQEYIPEFQVHDAQDSAKITVRHLLNQTSGIPTSAGLNYMYDTDTSDDALEDVVGDSKSIKLDDTPGKSWRYSNRNYTTLGLLVKVVSGEPYEDYVEQHIFTPLGMSHSYAYLTEARRHGLATGHQFWFGHPHSGGGLVNNRAITPTGLLSSTAEDMSRYLIAHLNGGVVDGNRILTPESVAELHRGVGDMGHDAKYAMGWINGDLDDVPVLAHNGDTGDFHATVIMEPRSKWGVVVLMNGANDLDVGQDRVAYTVMARLLGVKAPNDPSIAANISLLIVLGFAAIIVLQIAGAVRSTILIRRWRRDVRLRARGVKAVLLHLVGPWVVSVVWAGFALLILPPALSLPASLVLRIDIGWPIIISGAVALLWGVLAKPALAILTLRSRPPTPIDLPPTHVRVGSPA